MCVLLLRNMYREIFAAYNINSGVIDTQEIASSSVVPIACETRDGNVAACARMR